MKYIIYGKDRCTYCQASKVLLEKEGKEYEYKQLDDDYTFNDFMDLVVKFAPDHKTFPLIIEVDKKGKEKYIGGFSELDKKFKK